MATLLLLPLYIITAIIYYRAISKANKRIKYLLDLIEDERKTNNVTTNYCIKHIMSVYIANEEFENAAQAQKILDNIKKLEKYDEK